MTEAERLRRQAEHDAALKRLQGLVPRDNEGNRTGNPPFGLGILSGLSQRPVSRPYKTNSANDAATKTMEQRIAACKTRVTEHIKRVNANNSIPDAQQTAIVKKLQEKLLDCSTAHGLQKEENDKSHKDIDSDGKGGLVRQVTPGALRKNPNVLQSLIDAIWAFFKNMENRPEVVDRFMAKYPQPTTPPATSAVAFGIPGTY